MEMKRIVESIVRELVGAMRAEPVKPPNVLYVFCDSRAHDAYTDQFILLQNHGIQFDLMFLDGETSGWLGRHKIEAGSPGKIIAADEFAPAPLEIPLAYDGIVIPEMDLDNAARAALGMRGTIKSELVYSALVLNKFVLIGEDIHGIKRADRRTLSTLALPTGYRKLFDYYKKEMRAFGVELAPVKQLGERVVRKFADAALEVEADRQNEEKAPASDGCKAAHQPAERNRDGEMTFEGRLVSAEWVKRQAAGEAFTRLALGKGTIVSPLAKDMLRERGVAVHYADER